MKITLTLEEAKQIISNHFGEWAAEIEIYTVTNTFDLERHCREAVENFKYSTTQKIDAIKALRETIINRGKLDIGLAEAKWAVENWLKWIEFVKVNKRLPVEGYQCNGGVLK